MLFKKIYILLIVLILASAVYADDSLIQIKQKLEKIERDISDLQRVVFAKKDTLSSNDNDKQDLNPNITIFDMRLRDIEGELQTINLNYENISFEIIDLKNTLQDLALELNNAIIAINTRLDNSINTNTGNKNILALDESDSLEQIQEKNTLGTLKINSNDLSDPNNIEADESINIYLSPEEQFQAAFDNLRSQKFEHAKIDLELFIKDHANHNLAGSAHYWLGEIYLLQKQYHEAALVFAEGYQKYTKSVKSPDTLYKLAEALVKIEKIEEACNTLNQFVLKYPDNKLIDKTQSKLNDLQCS